LSSQPLSAEEFREAIGHFASGVTVITALHGGQAFGTTASAVCSVSLEPPTLLVCMNRSSATGLAIDRSGRFAVNILTDRQADLAERFARRGGGFDGVAVEPGRHGEPLLAEALATIECRVIERAAGGTHTVFIAAVDRASARSGATPLAYFRGEFGLIHRLPGTTAPG
jgi:flavin reductase (DIM6/NTAB) family NADH-FMN oxidoreductase RutF